MTEVVYYLAASLDGLIATSDGGVEWLAEFENSGDDYGYGEFYASIDAVLLGRKTYEQSLSFGPWPYPGKPCWVFTHRPAETPTPDITLTDADPTEVVAELTRKELRRAWLVGGAELAGSFQREGLISEYIVSVIPVILGSGIPMLASPGRSDRLKFVERRPYSNGVIQLRYRSVLAGQEPG